MKDADRKLLPLLSGWLDGELSPQDAARVEAALEHSAELRAIVDAWRRLDDAVPRHQPARSDAAWEALALRVENAIAAEEARTTRPIRTTESATTRSAPGWLDRLWAGLGSHRWAVGGGGALVAALLLLFLWPDPQGLLRNAGVFEDAPAPSMQTTPSAGAGSAPEESIVRRKAEQEPIDPDASTASEAERTDLARLEEQQAVDGPTGQTRRREEQEAGRKATDEALYVRGGRSQEVGARLDAVDPRPKREDDHSSGESIVQQQTLAPTPQSRNMSYRMSGPADDIWRIQMETDLQSAVSAGDRDDLQRLVTEIDRHRVDQPEKNEDIATLDLAVRARGELLRLSAGDADACARLRQDWAAWQRLAGPERDASWEGLRLRNLVQDVCPE